MIKIGDENFYLPLAKIRFLRKKRGGTQNQQKFQPSRIELKFSGQINEQDWG